MRPRSKVWIEQGGQVLLSEWRVELLVTIERQGSLTAAAAELGIPYRTAWSRLREMEERLGYKLLQSQSGGAEGGSSTLTPEAHQLIARFRRVADGISLIIDERFRVEFGDAEASETE